MRPHSPSWLQEAKPQPSEAVMGSAPAFVHFERPAPRSWLLPLVVAALTYLTYAASLRFGFVYDDRIQILKNPWLDSWSHFADYFRYHVFAFLGVYEDGFFWRPFFLLWMKINYSLFGLNPAAWHAATLLLHALAAGLSSVLALRLFGDRFAALFVGLFAGIYPVTIETAAWNAGITDSMTEIFCLASLLFYLRWRDEPTRLPWPLLSLLMFACGLMSKETAIVLPAILAAHALLLGQTGGRRLRLGGLARVLAPYAAVLVVYWALRLLILTGQAQQYSNVASILLTIPSLLWFYLRLLVFPLSVSPHYNFRVVTSPGLANFVLPLVLLLALTAGVGLLVRRGRGPSPTLPHRSRLALFAVVWILLSLAPVLYVRHMQFDDAAHIRYLYMPCFGYGILIALALGKLRSGPLVFARPASQVAAAIAVLGVSAAITARMQMHWTSDFALFSHAVKVAPHNSSALTDYAVELGERKHFDEALQYFRRALQLNPDLWYAHLNLGLTYILLGEYQSAVTHLERSLPLKPRDSQQYLYLATAEAKLGHWERAEWAMHEAMRRAPGNGEYPYALGVIFEQQGKFEQAAEAYRAALHLDPGNQRAQRRLAAIAGGS